MFALNVRRFRFSERKSRVFGLVFGFILVTLLFSTYFHLKNVSISRIQDERMGVTLTRVFHALVSDLRGLYIYDLSATPAPADGSVSLTWRFLPGRKIFTGGRFEVFRSAQRIIARDDLEKCLKIAELPLTAVSYKDTGIVRAGDYYYAVVLRNPENQYPLVPAKNSLSTAVEVRAPIRDLQASFKEPTVQLT